MQTPYGLGPYQLPEMDAIEEETGQVWRRRTSPVDDKRFQREWDAKVNIFVHWNYIFGFTTLRQYLAWVDLKAGRRYLAANGVLLYRFSVPKAYLVIGDTQCAFHRGHAQIVDFRSPDFV